MLAELLHAQGACGTSTIGSSEAILLGGLAMKRRWTEARKAQVAPTRDFTRVCDLSDVQYPIPC